MSRQIDLLVVDERAADANITLFALNCAAPRLLALWLNSGDLALQYLARTTHLPQMVLLSHDMESISALAVLEIVRAHPNTCRVPVVMIASAASVPTPRGDEFDAHEYVARSADPDEYCLQIRSLLERWKVRQRAPLGMLGLQPSR